MKKSGHAEVNSIKKGLIGLESHYDNNDFPIDTFFLHLEGMPDAVWLNSRGIQVMRVSGWQEQTYYYHARKKSVLAYKASYNSQQSRSSALAQWLTPERLTPTSTCQLISPQSLTNMDASLLK